MDRKVSSMLWDDLNNAKTILEFQKIDRVAQYYSSFHEQEANAAGRLAVHHVLKKF